MLRVSEVRKILDENGLTVWEGVGVEVRSSLDAKVKISCTRIGSVDEFRSFNENLQHTLGEKFSQMSAWHEMSYRNQRNEKITVHIKRHPSTGKYEWTIEF